ncbi:MAG: amidase family protein [Halioglobus sp.]
MRAHLLIQLGLATALALAITACSDQASEAEANAIPSTTMDADISGASMDSSDKDRPAPFSVVEASFADMQAAMADGRITSRAIVEQYLDRIDRYENTLHATLAVSDTALALAEALDRERAAGKVRGPLHGIPVALKDNIHTTDMPTTGGALAFKGYTPPYEATLVENLRAAGAIIIAKTTLTELANWVATGMPNSYNAVRGYGYNPYDTRQDPREGFNDGRGVMDTGGSSSGIGTAANLWAASVGTETSGSIAIPANNNMLASIKPTVGRISRYGIIPITADQDTAGPMGKSVADVATLLAAMESDDKHDAAAGVCQSDSGKNYADHFTIDGLAGARIGIPRAFFYDPFTPPGSEDALGGLTQAQKAAMDSAIEVLKQQGAIVVENTDIPSVISPDPESNQLLFGNCFDVGNAKGKDSNCSVILKYGMKRDFNRWLATLGDTAPVKTLTDLREFNLAHASQGAIRYGQTQLDISDEMDAEEDAPRWQADREKDIRLSRSEGIDAALQEHSLDALFLPAWFAENIVNKAGYPAVGVPFALVDNTLEPPLPAGFDPAPIPFGVTFVGTACSEARLIELAYSFEQATRKRTSPKAFP